MLTEGGMDAELGDVTGSFATPVPRARSRSKGSLRLGGSGLGGDGEGVREEDEEEEDVAALLDEGRGDEQGSEDESDEKTVMFNQGSSFPLFFTHSHALSLTIFPHTRPSLPNSSAPIHSQDPEPTSTSTPPSPAASHVSEISIDPDAQASPITPRAENEEPQLSTPTKLGGSGSGRLKIRVTGDVERIVVRFCSFCSFRFVPVFVCLAVRLFCPPLFGHSAPVVSLSLPSHVLRIRSTN